VVELFFQWGPFPVRFYRPPRLLGLWDTEERVVEFRKTEYSRLQAELDIVRAGLPVEAASRLHTDGEIALLER
jgi:hypothetical protein